MERMAEQACRNCTNIKNHQAKARDNSLEVINAIIHEQDLLKKHKILAIKLDNLPIEKNLTGLIANQLMAIY